MPRQRQETRQPTPKRRPAPDSRVLDLVHLRRYTQGNAELEAELLSLFAGQLPGLVSQIRDGGAASDWKLAVHTLKGSARAIGAVAIGELALRLEEAGHAAPAKNKARLARLLDEAVADFAKEAKKLAL